MPHIMCVILHYMLEKVPVSLLPFTCTLGILAFLLILNENEVTGALFNRKIFKFNIAMFLVGILAKDRFCLKGGNLQNSRYSYKKLP